MTQMPEGQRERTTLLGEVGAQAWYFMRLEQGEVGGGETMDWQDWLESSGAK